MAMTCIFILIECWVYLAYGKVRLIFRTLVARVAFAISIIVIIVTIIYAVLYHCLFIYY